jgi:hypothetical protein
VQPVQSSATQVSPAATQASRATNGSTNGGAPAGAATKQATNGKEDDEDWWTE